MKFIAREDAIGCLQAVGVILFIIVCLVGLEVFREYRSTGRFPFDDCGDLPEPTTESALTALQNKLLNTPHYLKQFQDIGGRLDIFERALPHSGYSCPVPNPISRIRRATELASNAESPPPAIWLISVAELFPRNCGECKEKWDHVGLSGLINRCGQVSEIWSSKTPTTCGPIDNSR